MTEREFYQEIEGRTEDEKAKAMCSLSILFPAEGDDVEEYKSVATMDAAVYPAIIPKGLSMIDLLFESNTDIDYLRFSSVCEEFFELVTDANRNGDAIPTLCLTVAPIGDFADVLSVLNCVYSYVPTTAEKICTGLRFIAMTEQVSFLSLDEDELNSVMDEINDDAWYEE